MPTLCKPVISKEDGVVDDINTREMTKIARRSGCPANKLAGIMLNKMEGDKVRAGDTLFTICAENEQKLNSAYNYAEANLPYTFKKIILSTIR